MVDLLSKALIPVAKKTMMIEVPVPDTPPFLITRSASLYWRPNHISGVIRTGLRTDGISLSDFYREVVLEVLQMSVNSEWGNIFPQTKAGMGQAIDRMVEFDYSSEEVEILAHSAPRFKCDYTQTDWLPENLMIALPASREYLGWVHPTPEGISSVVHNSARAICFMVSNAKLDRILAERGKSGGEESRLPDGEGSE